MRFIKYINFDKWLNDNGFQHDPSKDIRFLGVFVRNRKVYIKQDSKEYYIIDVFTKISPKPDQTVRTDYIHQILHGMNVDTISSTVLIDAEHVKVDFRKTFWKQMCN